MSINNIIKYGNEEGLSEEVSPPHFELTAHQHELISFILSRHSDKLRELVCGLGSPLHVVLPQVFRENVQQFKRTLSDNNLEGLVLYAKKANKSACFVKGCADCNIGVDVASEEELVKAMASGVIGERIGISGPEKSSPLLALGIRHRCLIVIDSLSELQRTLSLSPELRTRVRILLRVRPDSQKTSRFGLTEEECRSALWVCSRNLDVIQLEGFSFHLSGYSLCERAQVASRLVEMCLEARSSGLISCRYVNIGGGFPVQYVDPKCWSAFQKEDSPKGYHAEKIFANFYPYGAVTHGASALSSILNYPVGSTLSLAEKMRRHEVDLIVEPGRALLDQSGFTLFKVQGVKNRFSEGDYAVVTVCGSSFNLSEQWFNSEYLPSPVLLGEQGAGTRPFLACIGGATCLENDMLTWRKIGFSRAIIQGDYLVYLNTAAYQMDSNESCFHELPLPKKCVIEHFYDRRGTNWRLDESSL